jgi:DNA-binding SARP family transcriptional activator/TolB-like protein
MRRDESHREPNSGSGLTIRLFGGMAIHDAAGVDYLPRSRKTRAIVAMLTQTAPKVVQRGQLTGLLWSQRGTAQGRASLRQAVHELQSTFGSVWNQILVAERHCLSINLDGVSVDALEAIGADTPRTELLTLFEVGFLEDLDGLDPAFDIWLSKERRRVAAIARMGGEAFLEERHPREAVIMAARSLLRLDPVNDSGWRALIEAHIEAGDRAAARLACEQWGEAMGLMPDEAPPAEMAAFLSRIRSGLEYHPPSPPRNEITAFRVMEQIMPPDRPGSVETVPDGVRPIGVNPNQIDVIPFGAAVTVQASPKGIAPDQGMLDLAVPDPVPFVLNKQVGAPEELTKTALDSPRGPTRSAHPPPSAHPMGHRLSESTVVPSVPMPGGAIPVNPIRNLAVPEEHRIEPGRLIPREAGERIAAPEHQDARTEPRIDAERRSSLRLGIRQMRVIGADVDPALAEGLAEEVTMALSRFRWISCVSGSSLAASAGEGHEVKLSWPGPDLDLVLDGTIQRGGAERVRITVRLLDMRAGEAVIWANRFDRDASDSLTLQDRVAAEIVAQIEPLLLIMEGDRAAAHNPQGMLPRDLVLRAVPAIYRMDRLSFHAAGELLEAALRADPTHTGALAWYAYWHLFLVGQGWTDDPDGATRRAGELADTAVAMDPNDARALTLAGHVRGFLLRRPFEAAVLHERAISLNPNLALAWCFSGFTLSYLGDHATALVRMTRAIELSPSDPHLFFFQAAIIMPYLLLGEYEEAVAAGRKAMELNPWFSSSFKGCLAALGHLGRPKEAASVLARLLKLEPSFAVQDAIRRTPMSLPKDVERYAEGLRRAGLPEW